MDYRILIKGGTVVDGSGAPAYAADVRVRDGRIAEIGPDLRAAEGERTIDATGCCVTPGFIEHHNHWDPAVWWSPAMDPLPAYGITTSINGNCGFSMAPAAPAVHADVVDIFDYFEDVAKEPSRTLIPWDWTKWSEYKASMQRKVKTPVHFAAFCGHVPLRLTVMGQDAWTRAATPDEIAQMVALLEDALAAGAMGLSSNLVDHDRNERPLPTLLADDAELSALFAAVARHPGATVQITVDTFMRRNAAQSLERLAPIAKAAGVRMQWAGLPTLQFQAPIRPAISALHEQYKAEGLDFSTGFMQVSPTSAMNFGQSLVFAQNGNFVWQELVNAKTWDEKRAMLADPDWRGRARESWDNQYPNSYLHHPDALTLRESESGYGPVGVTLADYIRQTGINHPSDAMAQWVLNNGAESVVFKKSWERDEEVLVALFRDPRALANITDSGAHGKLFCGAGDNVKLLTEFVRDTQRLTIEEAVHNLTGKLAGFFGLHDRGLIEVGKAADIAVFDLDEIEARPEERVWDVPDGEGGRTYRYTRAPAPMRLTLVAGVPTFDNGAFTGRFPGRFVGPEQSRPRAIAAE
jgi:N-acyl-D-aspartate/D-glutamate deacylase